GLEGCASAQHCARFCRSGFSRDRRYRESPSRLKPLLQRPSAQLAFEEGMVNDVIVDQGI
ncbi:hypothetical protein, partial [Xanthomonas sp. LMG 9002]|uniref:hypothetical protein n=1 Tax=Xanthomonas sp. LMG 9002 TaxID=1591158 RepID=UPI001F3EC3C9